MTVPVLKTALPMATQAIAVEMGANGPLKSRFKAAVQSAATKQNVLQLGWAGLSAAKSNFN